MYLILTESKWLYCWRFSWRWIDETLWLPVADSPWISSDHRRSGYSSGMLKFNAIILSNWPVPAIAATSTSQLLYALLYSKLLRLSPRIQPLQHPLFPDNAALKAFPRCTPKFIGKRYILQIPNPKLLDTATNSTSDQVPSIHYYPRTSDSICNQLQNHGSTRKCITHRLMSQIQIKNVHRVRLFKRYWIIC
jgi:hypothetical protein